MPLLDRNKFPPGGFSYREPKLNWPNAKNRLEKGLPFRLVARAIQIIRVQNPRSGLNPEMEACEAALDLYTCTRLGNDPAWCVPTADAVARAAATSQKPVPCASCGSRRSKRAQ